MKDTTWIRLVMAGDSTPLSTQEEKALFARLAEGDKSASDEIVLRNRRYVLSLIHNYLNYGVEGKELFNEGMLGLFDAMTGFDINRGFRFTTYAKHFILHRIRKYVNDNTNTSDVSLDQSSYYKDGYALIDRIPSDTYEEEIASEDSELYEAIKALEQEEKDIVLLHYGFTDYGIVSLDEISRKLGISISRVRMIHSQIKHKLRQRLRSH